MRPRKKRTALISDSLNLHYIKPIIKALEIKKSANKVSKSEWCSKALTSDKFAFW